MSSRKHNENLLQIAKKWLAGKATERERLEFDKWYDSFDDSSYQVNTADSEEELESRMKRAILIAAGIERQAAPRKIISFYKIAVAAVLLIVGSAGIYRYVFYDRSEQISLINKKNDILPGSSKAILTLSNGKTISLNQRQKGVVAKDGNATIGQKITGKLVYQEDIDLSKKAMTYNTLTTPRGGQYQIVLPDGTAVWLNAASSLTYPTAFTGDKRMVELSGEAYFEVAKNKHMPFYVKSGNQTVVVLGTHFNINAYRDELSIKTTLLEGAVKVSRSDGNETTIVPGQQAETFPTTADIKVASVNTNDVVAWKNGFFHFKNADIKSVMRQLSRWYDVDVRYDGDIKPRQFTGDMYRNMTAAQVLDVLRFTRINFTINKKSDDASQKEIVVTP